MKVAQSSTLKLELQNVVPLYAYVMKYFSYIFSFHMPPALIWAQDDAHSTQR